MDNNILNEIDLSEDEKSILEQINKKISGYVEKKTKENLSNIEDIMKSPKQLGDSPLYNKHITNYDREVFVRLEMEISAINEDGQLKEVGQILENFYHIPIPSGVDYVEQMTNFVDIFDKELNNCAIKIHSKNEQ